MRILIKAVELKAWISSTTSTIISEVRPVQDPIALAIESCKAEYLRKFRSPPTGPPGIASHLFGLRSYLHHPSTNLFDLSLARSPVHHPQFLLGQIWHPWPSIALSPPLSQAPTSFLLFSCLAIDIVGKPVSPHNNQPPR